MMLACNETVTLVRHQQTAGGDTYSCHVIVGVSWFGKAGSVLSNDGEQPFTSVTVRIPERLVPAPLPQAGDYMVRGVLGACPSRKTLDGLEGFRITFVGDNRRLSLLRHVVVKGGGKR